MKNLIKGILMLALALIAIYLVLNLIKGIFAALLPIAIVGGVLYIVYRMANSKSISGSSRSHLP